MPLEAHELSINALALQIEAAEALAAFASAYGARGLSAEASPRQFHTNSSILVCV